MVLFDLKSIKIKNHIILVSNHHQLICFKVSNSHEIFYLNVEIEDFW